MMINSSHIRIVVGFAVLAWLIGSGCSTNKTFTDDMYFSLDDADREYRTYQSRKEQAKSDPNRFSPTNDQTETDNQQQYTRDSDGTLIIRNDYYDDSEFDFDNYYDYAYSARIRRFGNSWNTWNYYDPFYTNYYWYNPMPMHWGTSIYQTYGWWGPSPVWPHGFFSNSLIVTHCWANTWGWNSWNNPYNFNGWGHNNWWHNPWHNNWHGGWWNPFDPWAFSGWNNPWNYSSWGFNQGYWHGFNHGHWIGFNQGMNWGNMYFNSFDNNSYYFGPRREIANKGNTAFNFSRMMQESGIEKDLVSSRIKNVPVSPVDRGVRPNQSGTLIPETRQDIQEGSNVNRSNLQSDKFTPANGQGTDRSEQQNQTGRDVIIIRNFDESQGTRGSQPTRQNENIVPANRNNNIVLPNDGRHNRSNSIENNATRSNDTHRNWNTRGRENYNIERKQEGRQRSGTFTEGSRTYQNNDNFFNRREGSNFPQPARQPQPSRGSNQGGGSVPTQRPR